MSEQPIELVSAALVAVQGELEAASFDSQNPFLRNRYASLGAVIEVSRPILLKHGLAVLQKPSSDGKVVVLRTSLVHKSGQTIDCGSIELPIGDEKGKSMAQVAGSLITYARRYAWSTVLGIYAEEDTDGHMPDKPPQKAVPRANQLKPLIDATPPPKPAPEAHSEPAKGDSAANSAEPYTGGDRPKLRMATLHKLLAAPGEPNRAMVTHFAMSKGYITGEQSLENWPVFCLPKSKEDMDKLHAEVQAFEVQMREQTVGADVDGGARMEDQS